MNKKELVRPIAMNFDVCILWVSGQITSIDQVVTWVGGFICPNIDEGWQYCMMRTAPAGNTDGDIIVILADDYENLDVDKQWKEISAGLKQWGVEHE